MVIRTELRTFREELQCGYENNPGNPCKGTMIFIRGESWVDAGFAGRRQGHTKNTHKCNKCGNEIVISEHYPRIVYVEMPVYAETPEHIEYF